MILYALERVVYNTGSQYRDYCVNNVPIQGIAGYMLVFYTKELARKYLKDAGLVSEIREIVLTEASSATNNE